jgi:hypothetical protein
MIGKTKKNCSIRYLAAAAEFEALMKAPPPQADLA